MDYELLFPGRFMKSVEFKGRDVTVKIVALETEMLPQDKGGDKLKGILAFETTNGKKVDKKLVLNRTNAECLKALFGRETDAWIGHAVTLYPAPYEDGTAIRVKGSPELKEPLTFELCLPRKKPRTVRLLPTGQSAQAAPLPTEGAA